MQSQQVALQPTDVAYILTLLALIEGGRKTSETIKFQDHLTPLNVLCFLGDRINLQSVRHYSSLKNFLDDMQSYLSDPNDPNNNQQPCNPFVTKLHDWLKSIESIDDLVHLAESINTVFESDSTISPNEIMAPTKICSESSLGIYCRSFIAKWECLSFDCVYQLYESLTYFISIQEYGNGNNISSKKIFLSQNNPIDERQ